MDLNVVLNGENKRIEVERFIHNVFLNQYGADVHEFLPWLLSIHDKNGNINSALGLRSAGDDTLFLEQYLNTSIEETASGIIGKDIKREEIIEVGNLAAVSLGGARLLIYMLTAFLRGAGYKWVVFTAPSLLVNSFKRLELPLYHLANATIESLDNNNADWGDYYDHKPQVVIGNVDKGFEVLGGPQNLDRAGAAMVWNQAYSKGYMCRVERNNIIPKMVA